MKSVVERLIGSSGRGRLRPSSAQSVGVQEIRVLAGHTAPVRLLIALDSESFASAGDDGLIFLWDAQTGARLAEFHGHRAPITSLILLDPIRLVSGSRDGEVRVWNISTWECSANTGHLQPVTILTPIPQVRLLDRVKSKNPPDLSRWHISSTGKALQKMQQTSQSEAVKLFCSASTDHLLNLWDNEANLIISIQRKSAEVLNAVIPISGSRLVCGTSKPELLVYDFSTGEIERCSGHSKLVTAVVPLPGRLFATASLDGSVIIWQGGPSERVHRIRELFKQQAPLTSLFLFGKKYLGVPIANGFEVYEIDQGKVVAKCPTGTRQVVSLLPLFGGRQIVTSTKESELLVWSSENLKEISPTARLPKRLEMTIPTTLYGHTGRVSCLLSLNVITFVSGGTDGYVLLWTDQRHNSHVRSMIAIKSLEYHQTKVQKALEIEESRRKAKEEREKGQKGGREEYLSVQGKERGGEKKEKGEEGMDRGKRGSAGRGEGMLRVESSKRLSTDEWDSEKIKISEALSDQDAASILWDLMLDYPKSGFSSSPQRRPPSPTTAAGEKSLQKRRLITKKGPASQSTPKMASISSKFHSTEVQKTMKLGGGVNEKGGSEEEKYDDVYAKLDPSLTEKLLHRFPLCGICEGTEETQMITSKVRTAIQVLREAEVPNQRIKDFFLVALGHSPSYVSLLDAFLRGKKV